LPVLADNIEPIPAEENKDYEFFGFNCRRCYFKRNKYRLVIRASTNQLKDGYLIDQPMVNVRACLNDGATHAVDSSEMAFKLAAKYDFDLKFFPKAKPIILEPIMKLETSAPEEFQVCCIGPVEPEKGMITNTAVDAGYVLSSKLKFH